MARSKPSTDGNGVGQAMNGEMNYGYDVTASAIGENKYYLAANDILDVVNKQIGAKLTHTLSPSTFYEVKYKSLYHRIRSRTS